MDKIYKIECRTGCSCCSYENHYRGLYRTREEASARIARFRRGEDNPVASQYSKYGNYSIEEETLEKISENRIIVGGCKVYSENQIITVNLEDGSIEDDDYLESTNE